ncbi:MAG TPA: hypothetical protein VL988_10695 [Solirubrobacteraceae bacterium]|nr:hypothetical protein [Solirubrobacteraceae bacterium]
MSDRWFLFTQFEFPWELGPQDGRYLMRAGPDSEPDRVVVLGTLGARRRPPSRAQVWSAATRAGSRAKAVEPEPEPTRVVTARATIVDPVSVSAERQAKAWLSELDREREIVAAIAALNRVLHHHRIAAADPHVHEVSPEQALVIRAGWGEGEQVADGVWTHAVELPWRGPGGARRKRIGDRAAALRPQERLAVLLGGRGAALVCEELALRARGDLDRGRLAHAAIELQGAYAMALHELPGERREDLTIRIDELQKLREGVERQARIARGEPAGADSASGAEAAGEAADGEQAPGREAPGELDEEALRHALGRLEATLRARTATGFRLG